jgi:hypothetical protein
VLGLGVKHVMLADKLDIGADLSFTRSKSDLSVDTSYLAQPRFPAGRTSQDLQGLRPTSWATTCGSTAASGTSATAPTDWRLDGVMPGTVQNLLSLGQQSPDYRVTVLNVSLRYNF